jgi:hypothetical protein
MKFLLLVFPLFFFACGSSTQQTTDSFALDSAMKAATQQAPKKGSFYKSDNSLTDPDNHKGYDLMKNETLGKLKLGLDSKKAIAELGNPETKWAVELWGADGLYHQTWTYESAGIGLNMSGNDSLNMEIWSLNFYAPCTLKTSRNIGIGSSIDEVKAAYKEELNETYSTYKSLVAGSVYGGIIFNFENWKVSSVFIGSAAE